MSPLDLGTHRFPLSRLAVEEAIRAARTSTCAKDKRGAAVFHRQHPTHAAASNGPPHPFFCDGSEACRAACGKLAVHAEERALQIHQRKTGLTGADVVHIRVVDGQPVTSGAPSCTTCSRTMLEGKVARIWLWHDTGWRAYEADEFHEISLRHPKHDLPIIRRR